MKYFKNYRLGIIIFIMIVFKCNQQNDHLINTEPNINNQSKVNNQKFQTEIKNDSVCSKVESIDTNLNSINQKIIPMREWWSPGSLYSRERWIFDHYEPISGKVLGIWPISNSLEWSRLRTIWGFTGILVGPVNYQRAINAGFNWKSMMVIVGPNDYENIIDNYPSSAYYSGEPFHRNCPILGLTGDWINPEWKNNLHKLAIIRNYANQRNSKYVIDHYFDCDHVLSYFNNVDIIMYDGYRRHDMLTSECFISWGEDQRHTWTRWRTLFPDHFKRVWIGTGIPDPDQDNDDNEFDQLLGHAANLGLRDFGQVWLFAGENTTEGNLGNFCYLAWKHGYLRRFERLVYDVYECICPTGCYQPPMIEPECWQYIRTNPSNTIREVFP